jgi:hypothetical protein
LSIDKLAFIDRLDSSLANCNNGDGFECKQRWKFLINVKDEKRARKDGDKPSWGNCTADEAFA